MWQWLLGLIVNITAQALPNIRFAGSTPARAFKPATYSVPRQAGRLPVRYDMLRDEYAFCMSQVFKNTQGAATAACNGYQSS